VHVFRKFERSNGPLRPYRVAIVAQPLSVFSGVKFQIGTIDTALTLTMHQLVSTSLPLLRLGTDGCCVTSSDPLQYLRAAGQFHHQHVHIFPPFCHSFQFVSAFCLCRRCGYIRWRRYESISYTNESFIGLAPGTWYTPQNPPLTGSSLLTFFNHGTMLIKVDRYWSLWMAHWQQRSCSGIG
jgi:hypothetical protein